MEYGIISNGCLYIAVYMIIIIWGKNNMAFKKERLYKMAGNSIVVNVLEAIFKNLFGGEKYEKSND